jgi:polyisoprenoid-binding protein YceI
VPRYRILPERSYVWIDGRSNVHPISVATDGLEGHVELTLLASGEVDVTAPVTGRLSLSVDRLSSGNRVEDMELQRRIDARRFPTLEGVLRKVGPAGDRGDYRVGGDVVFRGVSRHHEDLMEITSVDDQTVRLAGRSTFDVRDFGMEPPRLLLLKVEPEVQIRVEIFALREP